VSCDRAADWSSSRPRPGPRGWLQIFFELYFRRVVPLLGKLVAGDASAYTYLPESTLAFVEPSRLMDVLRAAGLQDVQSRALCARRRRSDVRPQTLGYIPLNTGRRGMRSLTGTSGRAALSALALGLALFSVARAQDEGFGQQGLIEGAVARLRERRRDAREQRRRGRRGAARRGSPALATTAASSSRCPRARTTVTATAPDGFASRPYVPVETGQTLDIGILDIGGGRRWLRACPEDVTAPALPTFTANGCGNDGPPDIDPGTRRRRPLPSRPPAPAPVDQAPSPDAPPADDMARRGLGRLDLGPG